MNNADRCRPRWCLHWSGTDMPHTCMTQDPKPSYTCHCGKSYGSQHALLVHQKMRHQEQGGTA